MTTRWEKTSPAATVAAYRFYKASRPGLKNIRAVSRNTSGTGFLLVVKPGASVVAVDVEGSLLQGGFMSPGRPESRKAVESIAIRYPLIFLQSGETSLKAVRYWLQQNEYADAPLLPWDGGTVFDTLAKKGVKIRAVIGGAAVIESAARAQTGGLQLHSTERGGAPEGLEGIGRKAQVRQP